MSGLTIDMKNKLSKMLNGWNIFELFILFFVFCLIAFSAFWMKDNPVAIVSAICGILYTMLAGKGRVHCFYFGVLSSVCYCWLAFNSHLWGSLALYLLYYIPSQIIGIFRWKKNLKEDASEIIKTRLNKKEFWLVSLFSFLGCLLAIILLHYLGSQKPYTDGIVTIMSIVGMYLTVKRCIEQWFAWLIVNGAAFIMWLQLVIAGENTYSTMFMWGAYFVITIYYFFIWKKEIAYKFKFN